MIRVLIVDDERLERVLIRKSYNWQEHGLTIIGEAGDAQSAFQLCREGHPDVVFADINMPSQNGLDMCMEMRKSCPELKIVFITGHREFEYVKSAMHIGAKDFLLKPVQAQELAHIAEQLKREITQERQMKKRLNTSLPLLRNHQFRQLVTGQASSEETFEILLEPLYRDILSGAYICVIIRVLTEANDFPDEDAIGEALPDKDTAILFQDSPGTFVMLIRASAATDETLCKFHDQLVKVWDKPVNVAFSKAAAGVENASVCYEQASKALLGSVLLGTNAVISYGAYAQMESHGESDELVDFSKFEFAVKNGLRDQTVAFIDQYLLYYNQNGISELEQLHMIGIILLHHTLMAVMEYKQLLIVIQEKNIHGKVAHANSLSEFCAVFYPFILYVVDTVKELSLKSTHTIVDQCVQYIEENFRVPGISLKSVAAALYVNESYLSRIFRQTRNETLTEYIMQRRIKESLQLLKTTDMKIYEISEKIGMPDAHYFGQCFKRYMGMTVNQYLSKNVFSKV
jgi:Response regulator containing CheY-like receiver domain and AraC-type DNA-binding domain